MIVGSAIKVAQGRLRLDDLGLLLDQPMGLPHGKAPMCAPADGLYLKEVIYGVQMEPKA
jgi:tRNA U38,U39,U40 pseudouridine synthase TruA